LELVKQVANLRTALPETGKAEPGKGVARCIQCGNLLENLDELQDWRVAGEGRAVAAVAVAADAGRFVGLTGVFAHGVGLAFSWERGGFGSEGTKVDVLSAAIGREAAGTGQS